MLLACGFAAGWVEVFPAGARASLGLTMLGGVLAALAVVGGERVIGGAEATAGERAA